MTAGKRQPSTALNRDTAAQKLLVQAAAEVSQF